MGQNQNINYFKKKILLHACCGICSGYPISLLKDMGYCVVVYYYNPNIYPDSEYEKRLESERVLCKHFGCELIEGAYEHKLYDEYVKGLETEPEKGARCNKCFELRLEKTAQKALELGIEEFTTSIVISPHKNYEKISQIGEQIATKYDLKYKPFNFRKQDGFLKTNEISKSINLYRQKYCGCKFAIR